LFIRQVCRPVAFARRELIAQADVAKRAAHQDFMVTAPRSVAVELAPLDALRYQVAAGRAVRRDAAGRGDVISRDRVGQDGESSRRKTSLPSRSVPSASVARLRRMSPASA